MLLGMFHRKFLDLLTIFSNMGEALRLSFKLKSTDDFGLEIVLEADFKIDDSKWEIICRLKDPIQQNYDSTELEDSLQAVDDTSTTLVEADEEVDDDSQEIVIVIDDDSEED